MFLFIELLLLGVLCTILFRFKFYTAKKEITGEKPQGFSLVIPFRNEESNLYNLLYSLANQKLSIPYEIILVNDGSTDNFNKEIERARTEYPLLNITLLNSRFDNSIALSSKQQALELGVEASNYDWLIFTDADMQFNSGWLHTLYESTNSQSGRFVFGRTTIIENATLFSKFQSLQLSFLFGNAWFLAHARIDSSCMGNNIAIEKKLYKEIGGQKKIGYSIVEDKKLLSIVRKAGVVPTPSKHFYAFAKTEPASTFSQFMHQMIRWLKGGMQESRTLSILIIVFLLHLYASSSFLVHPQQFSEITLVSLTINWLILLSIFIFIFVKMKLKSQIWVLLLYLLFIPFEAIFIVPALLFIKPKWKGRTV